MLLNPCSFPLSLLWSLKLRWSPFSHAVALRLSWGNLLLMVSQICMGIFRFRNTVTYTTSFAFHSNPLRLLDVNYVHFIYTDPETQGSYWLAGPQAHSYQVAEAEKKPEPWPPNSGDFTKPHHPTSTCMHPEDTAFSSSPKRCAHGQHSVSTFCVYIPLASQLLDGLAVSHF